MLQIQQISPRGQITIPSSLRRQFGLQVKKPVLLLPKRDANEIIIRPIMNDLSELRGYIKAKRRPENWEQIRKKVKIKIAQRITAK